MIPNLDKLHKYAMKLTRNRADADDLVGDAVERILSHEWRPTGSYDGWCATILRRVFLSRCNRNKMARGYDLRNVAAWGCDRGVEYDGNIEAAELMARVDALPREFAEIVRLRAQGYEYAEIAEALAIPIGTVMSRLSRARERLS